MTHPKSIASVLAAAPCARCKVLPEIGRDCSGDVTWVTCPICEDEADTIEDWNAFPLHIAINDIAIRLAALPPPATPATGPGWYAAHRARQTAAEELVGHIRRQHGARITLGGDVERMRLHGIAVTCTGGTSNMISAWLAKARAALASSTRP